MITGLYGQELKVGDKIVFCAKSYGSSYMRAGVITKIETAARQILHKVYITYDKRDLEWDSLLRKHIPQPVKSRTSRIYNWRSAITLTDEQYDKIREAETA